MRLALMLIVAGCAHDASRPTASACSIAEVTFPAAADHFSRPLTATTLDKLAQITRADRELFRADPSGAKLGAGLAELNNDLGTGPFVAKPALEAATRLRQLGCAIQRGSFNGRPGDADSLYGDILGQVDKELKLARAQ